MTLPARPEAFRRGREKTLMMKKPPDITFKPTVSAVGPSSGPLEIIMLLQQSQKDVGNLRVLTSNAERRKASQAKRARKSS